MAALMHQSINGGITFLLTTKYASNPQFLEKDARLLAKYERTIAKHRR